MVVLCYLVEKENWDQENITDCNPMPTWMNVYNRSNCATASNNEAHTALVCMRMKYVCDIHTYMAVFAP